MKSPLMVFVLASLLLGAIPAAQAGGPRLNSLVKTQYFSVHGYEGIDLYTLLVKIHFRTFLRADDGTPPNPKDLKKALAQTLDALFEEVSQILNINISRFHVQLKIFEDERGVKAAYADLYQSDLRDNAFYDHQHQTICLSFADLSLEGLGYQIGQAIIAQYFVVKPPKDVTDVLSGFVEFNLRKTAGVATP